MRAFWGLCLVAVCGSTLLFACGDDDGGDADSADGQGGNPAGAAGRDSKGGASASGSSSGGAGAGEAGSDQVGGAGASGRLDPGGRAIELTPERFFPEGVTHDKNGNFYIGSMELGSIYRATANDAQAVPFITADDENQLISVIGLYADDATDTLWVCSSDAGNGARAGEGVAAIKAFSLPSGEFVASYDWPAFSGATLPETATNGINGFCNDLTMDAAGNLYATDSWYPRILRLPAGGDALEEWLVSDAFPQDQWHLNGIDIDQTSDTLYVVENHPGALFSVVIQPDGSAGTVTEIETSRPLLSPDGLKVLSPGLLVTAEGANEGGGVALLRVTGGTAEVEEVIKGFDQVATLALHQGSAWVVENQGDHFWGPDDNGPDADPPFRVVEVPLATGAGAGVIRINDTDFFPEGVTLDESDNFYVGSMNTGAIHKATPDDAETSAFIEPDETNNLVSVLGLYAHDATNTLWVCSSDAGNSERAGLAPAALKSFDLTTGELTGSWDWPANETPLPEADTGGVNGFCNDITVDDDGNVYATDSWYPRILRLPASAGPSDELEEWVRSAVFPSDQWHLNGLDIDRTNNVIYAVENHPGALYRIAITDDGTAGAVTEVSTSRPLYSPDGLKVLGDGLLAIAEGQTGGMSIISLEETPALVRRVSTGLDGIATFAVREGSAWLVENQGDHFWGDAGDPVKPFRLVEVPMNLP
ncbi:MAG TPA: SMP-30/gluconolactonase/LRE family protein [Polyangiaceae bacterium]